VNFQSLHKLNDSHPRPEIKTKFSFLSLTLVSLVCETHHCVCCVRDGGNDHDDDGVTVPAAATVCPIL
jgi:hypothetical protein